MGQAAAQPSYAEWRACHDLAGKHPPATLISFPRVPKPIDPCISDRFIPLFPIPRSWNAHHRRRREAQPKPPATRSRSEAEDYARSMTAPYPLGENTPPWLGWRWTTVRGEEICGQSEMAEKEHKPTDEVGNTVTFLGGAGSAAPRVEAESRVRGNGQCQVREGRQIC
jgi:hypothetical protein